MKPTGKFHERKSGNSNYKRPDISEGNGKAVKLLRMLIDNIAEQVMPPTDPNVKDFHLK